MELITRESENLKKRRENAKLKVKKEKALKAGKRKTKI